MNKYLLSNDNHIYYLAWLLSKRTQMGSRSYANGESRQCKFKLINHWV